jgi:uncharacterized Zn-binding protein involved in type VI secretion
MAGWSRENDPSRCLTDGATGVAIGVGRAVAVNGRRPLAMGDRGVYLACCGRPLVPWVVAEGSATVLINGIHAGRVGSGTAHQAGRGALIDGSPDVLVGGPTITMEELARADALDMLDKGEAALKRWDSQDRQHFREWFGDDSQYSRQALLEQIPDMRDQIKKLHFEQEDDTAWANVWPWGSTIYLERKFWLSPRLGRDSRAGVIIHETSHFWGEGSTADRAYGPTRSKALARNLPPSAQGNADNVEYYFEGLK